MTITAYKLTVECEPEVHAQIFINDLDTNQKTPYTFTLAEGIYRVKLSIPSGYFFREWRLDGLTVTNKPEVEFRLDKDSTLTAIIVTQTQQAVQATVSGIIALLSAILALSILITVVSLVKGLKW
ncbi:MAG: hypothetical protein QXZ68_05025 [Candidatus Bathyarchaeia archaeon]